MSMPAGAARGRRCRLHMASSRILLATTITWICAVSCILLTHTPPRTKHIAHHPQPPHPPGGLVGARECPCQLEKYGKISAGSVWKLQNMSGCYFSVDMCRILLTHTPPRTKHVLAHPRPPHLLFGLVFAFSGR